MSPKQIKEIEEIAEEMDSQNGVWDIEEIASMEEIAQLEEGIYDIAAVNAVFGRLA